MSAEKIDLSEIETITRSRYGQEHPVLALVAAVRAARAYMMIPSLTQEVWMARRERLMLELAPFTDSNDSAEVRSDGE